MNQEQVSEKNLTQQLKAKLNSPEYVAIPEILGYEDRHGDMLAFVFGLAVGESVHSEKRDNFISDMSREKGDRIIYEHQLEPKDWEEIVNLIEKRNKEKEAAFEQRKNEIYEKLNNTHGLYYYWGGKRGDSHFDYPDKKGYYCGIVGKEHDRDYWLNINGNHPILDKFSFEKGFYYIEVDKSIERNDEFNRPWSDGGENNLNNFHKWVEVDDEITITPENGEKLTTTTGNPERKSSFNNPNKNLMAGGKNQKSTGLDRGETETKDNLVAFAKTEARPTTENKQLTQIIQTIQNLEQRIAELEKSGNNSQQVQVLKQQVKSLKTQKQAQLTKLDASIENKSANKQIANNSAKASTNYTPLIAGGLLVISAALVIGYLLGKDKNKK